jgi:amino acid transporter
VVLWWGGTVRAAAAGGAAWPATAATPLPALEAPLPRAAFIAAVCGTLAWVNVIGVRAGVRVLVVNTVIKLVPLALLIAVGLFAVQPGNLAIAEWPGAGEFGAAALVLFFAFAGAESALGASGEVREPARTVPLGLALGLGGILLVYLGLQAVAQGVLGPALAANTDAPLAATARTVFGGWGASMILAATAMSIFATVSGDMLATPRVIFASARAGHLPAWLARVHPRYRTPSRSIAAFAAAIALLAISGTFRPLAGVASGSILLVYLGVSVAVLRLRARDGLPPAGTFRLPGGFVVPVLSCGVIAWFLWHLPADEARALAALVGAAVVIAAARRLHLRRPTIAQRI